MRTTVRTDWLLSTRGYSSYKKIQFVKEDTVRTRRYSSYKKIQFVREDTVRTRRYSSYKKIQFVQEDTVRTRRYTSYKKHKYQIKLFSATNTSLSQHITEYFFTFMWWCILTNLFVIKPTRCTNFTNLFCRENLHISDSSSVHHQEFIHCTLRNGICHTGL